MLLIIGLLIGAFFGVFIMCLMQIARDPGIGLGDEEPLCVHAQPWDDCPDCRSDNA